MAVNPAGAGMSVAQRFGGAAGLAHVRPGFCFSADFDALFALGWPHVRFVVDGHRDDESPHAAALRILTAGGDPPARLRWPRGVAQGGIVKSVFATPAFVMTVVKSGSRAKVVRTDVTSGTARTVWSGSGTPVVAAGGNAIVIGSGSKVFSSKGGAKARAAGTAKGIVAALATDGTRIVVFERITRKVTVKKRATNVKSTVGRVLGSVR